MSTELFLKHFINYTYPKQQLKKKKQKDIF